jgi:hypothetical protein
MRCGCRRGETFEGYDDAGGEPALVRGDTCDPASLLAGARIADEGIRGNPANLRSGTGLQHARNPSVEEAVEVVRNHEDGTGRDGLAAIARGMRASAGLLEWTPAEGETLHRVTGAGTGEGAYTKDESQERKGILGSPAPCRER